jgi:hypothetical protein
MKPLTRFVSITIPGLLLAVGCGPDSGVIAPGMPSDDIKVSLASKRDLVWSDPENLGKVINSSSTDQHPALSKDGLTLYFASNRPTDDVDTDPDQNIWVAQRACTDNDDEDCAWNEPVALGPAVNGPSLDVSPTLSRDEHQLFFSSKRPHNHCSGTSPCNNRDLWVSYREGVHDDFGWQAAVNLGSPLNTPGEEVAPSYFENDGAGPPQLFFNDGVENASGVLTLGDIYVSQLTSDGTWGKPSAVGEIKTSFSDQRPSVSHDGLELYFHSTRPTPEGGAPLAHIWVATRQRVSDPWSAPTLVPPPISNLQTIQPFIHSHGKTETLLFVRGGDLWMSERKRTRVSE